MYIYLEETSMYKSILYSINFISVSTGNTVFEVVYETKAQMVENLNRYLDPLIGETFICLEKDRYGREYHIPRKDTFIVKTEEKETFNVTRS